MKEDVKSLGDIDRIEEMLRGMRKEIRLSDLSKEIPKLVELDGICDICYDPLLQDIGKPSFGVTSYHCKCSVVRMIHVPCCFSSRSKAKCAYCREEVVFIASGMGSTRSKTMKLSVARDVGEASKMAISVDSSGTDDESASDESPGDL